MDWRGRAREREVKLQLFGVPRNPYYGLAWSRATLTMGRGVACDFCRVSLVTSVPVSLVTSQSLPYKMLQCRDFWIFGYLGDPPSLSSPFSSPSSSLFHLLPSILFHGAQHAQEDLPMMPMRLIVLMPKPASFSDPSGRGFARNCLGARTCLMIFFVGVTEISLKHCSLEPKNMQACQPQTQPSQCFNPEMSKPFKSPQLQRQGFSTAAHIPPTGTLAPTPIEAYIWSRVACRYPPPPPPRHGIPPPQMVKPEP